MTSQHSSTSLSSNESAVAAMLLACSAHGVTRLAIVGASPASRRQLRDLVGGSAVRIRFVDGLDRLSRRHSGPIVDWADVIVICASAQIKHRVSRLFTSDPRSRGKLLMVSCRGIAAIAREITRFVRR